MAARARSGAGMATPALRMDCATAQHSRRSFVPAASSIWRTFSAEGRGAAGAVTGAAFAGPDAVVVEPAGAALFCTAPCGQAAPGPDAVICPANPAVFCGVPSADGFSDGSLLFRAVTAVASCCGVSTAFMEASGWQTKATSSWQRLAGLPASDGSPCAKAIASRKATAARSSLVVTDGMAFPDPMPPTTIPECF